MPEQSVTTFANPFLACDVCRRYITGATNVGQDGPTKNVPCGHRAGATSRCPSWGPVDGCQCQEHLGEVPHPPVSASFRAPGEPTEGGARDA